MRLIVVLLFLSIIFAIGGFLAYTKLSPKPPLETKFVQPEKEVSLLPQTSGVVIRQPPESYLLKSPKHIYQTFNNCGPATLAMILSWYGIDKSQQELGLEIRPYQNPKGDNDDKTIFAAEFVLWAQKYGLTSLYRVNRVNGSIEILKLFASNDIPVIVKTWLRVNEDIGHFRIVKGFDEGQKVIIQDDSYHGPNKKISYFDFLSLWQPFNYTYILVYPKEKQEVVEAIFGKGKDEHLVFEKALRRAEEEAKLAPENLYPLFNLA